MNSISVFFYLEGMWCSRSDKNFNQTSMMLIFRGQNSYSETCVAGKTQAYLDSLIRNTEQGNMPSHNKDSKVFGNQGGDYMVDEELNESDIEILETVKLESVKTEDTKPVKLKVKKEIRTEFHTIVGFSKPKQRSSTATFATALKSLIRAKKECASVEIKKESSQRRTQLIRSGTLRPTEIATKACNSNKEIEVQCEFCTDCLPSRRKYIKHCNEVHPEEPWICSVCARAYQSYNGCYKHEKSHGEYCYIRILSLFRLFNKCLNCVEKEARVLCL